MPGFKLVTESSWLEDGMILHRCKKMRSLAPAFEPYLTFSEGIYQIKASSTHGRILYPSLM